MMFLIASRNLAYQR